MSSAGHSEEQAGSQERALRADSNSLAEGPFSPLGLKVLVVDDDPMCLKVVSAMLQRCNYTVETRSNGHDALSLLREKNDDLTCDQFDLVLSDVYMPDMDGFRLLEHIGLELELPVIMMSSNGDTDVVLRGVTHGAVDFLIKPVRIEELRNVWQHVVRRRSLAMSRSADGEECSDDSRQGGGVKRKESEALTVQLEGGGNKKPRVVWSVEMHQQFVNAVNQLGIDKAVPKRILDLMNVEGLTRENVASHLQKYRLYLKRVQGVAGGKGGRGKGFGGSFGSFGGLYGEDTPSSSMGCMGGGAAMSGGAGSMGPAPLAVGHVAQQHHQPHQPQQQQQQQAPHAPPMMPPPPMGMGMPGGPPPGMAAAWHHQNLAMHAAAAAAASGAMPGAPMPMPPFMPPFFQGGLGPMGLPPITGVPPQCIEPKREIKAGYVGGGLFPPPHHTLPIPGLGSYPGGQPSSVAMGSHSSALTPVSSGFLSAAEGHGAPAEPGPASAPMGAPPPLPEPSFSPEEDRLLSDLADSFLPDVEGAADGDNSVGNFLELFL